MTSRRPVEALTGLRFIAAFAVAFSHGISHVWPWVGATPEWYSLLNSGAGVGMPLFFVLSGFVIQYNYSERIREGGSRALFNFFVARFARLYPLYFLCIAYDVMNSVSYEQPKPYTLEVLPYFLTMTQSWFYIGFGNNALIYSLGIIPSIAWSVSTEWFFYVAYPVICFLLAAMKSERARSLAAAAVVVAGFGAAWFVIANLARIDAHATTIFGPVASMKTGFQDSFFRWALYFSPYSRIFEFALGCAAASIYMNRRGAANQNVGKILTIAAIVWTLFWYYIVFGLGVHNYAWINSFNMLHMSFGLAPGIGLLIYCCARYDNWIVRLLSTPWLILCGEASYSLYLLHGLVVEMFTPSAAPARTFLSGAGDAMRLGVCMAACVGLSLVTWRCIEVPARNAIRKLLTIKKPALLPDAEPAAP